MHEAARMGEHTRLTRRQQPGHLAEIGKDTHFRRQQGNRVIRGGTIHGEDLPTLPFTEPSPRPARHAERAGSLPRQQNGLGGAFRHAAHQAAGAPDGGENRPGISKGRFNEGGVFAAMGCPV
jgi:hypothetical protein